MLERWLLLAVIVGIAFGRSPQLISLGEDNWKQVLKGEWMIEFHAPWCPACKDLAKTWDSFASWSKDLNIKVGEVDVTKHSGLSGRFLVTALPTIYHVKEGVFRAYGGPRDKEDFMQFIEEKKWSAVEPTSAWRHPDSPQMSVVAMFFRMSMHVRDLHNDLVEQRGLPVWASYAVFGLATLLLGCILGFLIVCLIDCAFPAGAAPVAPVGKNKGKGKDKNKKQDEAKKKQAEEDKARQSQSEADTASQYSQTDAEDSADEATARQRKKEKDAKNAKSKDGNNNKSPQKESKKKK